MVVVVVDWGEEGMGVVCEDEEEGLEHEQEQQEQEQQEQERDRVVVVVVGRMLVSADSNTHGTFLVL